MEIANTKSMILANIVDITRIVRGKYILVISPLEATNDDAADEIELVKRFQGKRAVKRKME